MLIRVDRATRQFRQRHGLARGLRETVGEASLDPAGQIITDFDIGDPKTAGIPLNWLEHGLPSLTPSTQDR